MGKKERGLKEVSSEDALIRTMARIMSPISRYFDVSLTGLEHLPEQGGVMLVGNHALLGVDSWALMPELMRQTGRVPRGLALRKLFDVPLLSTFLEEVGLVAGERESAVELLRREELVLTYPGGARDSLKTRSERYTLKWDGRRGFAHVALEAQRPVVPIVGVGPDECFRLIGPDQGILPMSGLSGEALKVPLFIPFARRVPFSFHVGEPLMPPPCPEGLDREARRALVERFAQEVEAATQALLTHHAERVCAEAPSPRPRLFSLLSPRFSHE